MAEDEESAWETVARQLAALLGKIDAGEMDATPGMRARIEGAVIALDEVARLKPYDRLV